MEDSISVLAAYGAPLSWVMTAAFVVQAAAMAGAGYRVRRSAGPVAVLLGLNAVATLVVAAARISCGDAQATWCVPSEHPTSYAVHVAAATVALSALALAPLAAAVGLRRRAPRWAIFGLGAGAVMMPLLAYFAVVDGTGWAEKVVVTVGIFWAAALALGAIVGPPRHHQRRDRGPDRGLGRPGGVR